MNDQTHKDKGFLKDKLGDYQVNPPEKVWNSISDQLPGGRSRRNMIILVFAAAASLALAISLGIQYFSPELPQESAQAIEEPPLESASPESLSPLEEKVKEAMEDSGIKEPGTQEGTTERESLALQDQTQKDIEIEDLAMQNLEPEQQFKLVQQFKLEQQTEPLQIESDEQIEPENQVEPKQQVEPELQIEPQQDEEQELLAQPSDPLPDFTGEKKKENRWMVGAAMSPLYSFRDAESRVMAGAGVHESGIISYSSGVHVNYKRSSRLAFETGVFFNKTGLAIGAAGIQAYNQQSDYLLFGAGSESADIKAVTNSVGNIISNSGEIFVNGYKMNAQNTPEALLDNNFNRQGNAAEGIEQHLDYLELPFNLRYTVIDRAFELQLVGGLSTNFLVNNYVTMETSSGKQEIGYLTNIRSVNYSGNAGLGMIYHLGKNLNLMIEPRFRYFLNSINDATLPSTRPYSLGLYTSINFTF